MTAKKMPLRDWHIDFLRFQGTVHDLIRCECVCSPLGVIKSGARFSKVSIIKGQGELLLFTFKIDDLIFLQIT